MPPHDALYDLPAPVELVLDDENAHVPDTSPMPLGEVVAAKDIGNVSRRHCSISISEEDNQIHEIDTCYTQEEKEQLWYTNDEFFAMVREAGYKLPETKQQFQPSSPPQRSRRSRAAQLIETPTSWFVRSLWIGTIVVGVLATTSVFTSDASSKRER